MKTVGSLGGVQPAPGCFAPSAAGATLDDFVRAFERAYSDRGGADPAAYLPPAGHPLHAAVLRELVRVDLEFGWGRGCPKGLAAYQLTFPSLAADREGLREIAFEEYRLRVQAGEDPTPDEYQALYGFGVWSGSRSRSESGPSRRAPGRRPDPGHGRPFGGDDHDDPAPALPVAGDEFLGFRLIGELGRGAFGRVFLARQGDLADRPVVLKVTADGFDESQTLAQLRHDNIVPVYSRHREGRLRAVCMPYLGSVTLRDVIDDLRGMAAMPGSGLGLLSSQGKGSARRSGSTAPEPTPPTAPDTGAPARREGTVGGDEVRAMLGRLTYVEAVVWMGARLADGLAHAHDRGILHRDLKPANILIADDGRPMLLDFNLAEDLKLRETGAGAGSSGSGVGGTLPYMAPEHLAAYRDGTRSAVDARSDLYALGVILFEMLTGRPPFPVRDGARPEVVRAMLADRRGAAPRLRPWNPAVSPAVESVVRRCLAADPSRRYASARELGEDLGRHLAHRPLRHAPDPSRRERAAKWGRRNRWWLVAAAVLAAAAAVVSGFALTLSSRADRIDRLEARAALGRFRVDSVSALNLVGTSAGSGDLVRRREGRAAVERALAGFHVRADPDPSAPWWDRPPADRLPPADRARLRAEAGELLLMLARTGLAEGGSAADREALRDNARAGRCFEPGPVPRGVWSQRAVLHERLGDRRAAEAAARRASAAAPATAADYLFLADGLLDAGKPAEALPLLETAVRLAPDRYRAWLGLGNCQARLAHYGQAESCFSTCIALWPGHPAGWVNRALALRSQGKPGPALADFRRVAALRPGDPDIPADVGSTLLDLGRPAEASLAFDRALALSKPNPRVYFMRAEARTRLGDAGGARRDTDEGLRREPTDEPGWTARALHRLARGDAAGALADLDRALALCPGSYRVLVNRAVVLSGRLGRTADGIAALDRAVELFPDRAEVRSDRAVLLARLGRREAALADADRAVELQPTPHLRWQAACVYALTSRRAPGDRAPAVAHLASALRLDPGIVGRVEADPDLAPIRDDPEYPRIIARARAAPAAGDGR